jgi:hypothetical protein
MGSATHCWAQRPARSLRATQASQTSASTTVADVPDSPKSTSASDQPTNLPPVESLPTPESPPPPPPAPTAAVQEPPGTAKPAAQPPVGDYAPPGLEPRGPQEGPGAPEFLRPTPARFPAYYFDPGYYDTYGIGARPLADYAPPGYMPREDPHGEGPAVPEFTPMTVPLQYTPDELNKFVTRGMFPGSFLVPGTTTSFRLRGFVRLVGLYDFNPIDFKDQFITSGIPVPQTHGENANFSARISRIGLETWTPTTFHDWTVHTFIDADFIQGPDQTFSGSSNPFRLRNAWVDFGYFRVGQQDTVFMDSQAWPSTVDFGGPRGIANQRLPLARMTIPLCDTVYWATGIQQPFSDITTNGLGKGEQQVPDFATHLRYEGNVGHVQLSSIFRSIGFRPTVGETQNEFGWGASASTVFHPWAILMGTDPVHDEHPSGLSLSRILLQYNVGNGIGRNIDDLLGLGLDAQVDPVTGQLHTVYASGWCASYEHWFNEKWLANLTYSGVLTGSAPNQPGNTYVGAKYLAASLWWIPVGGFSTGIEYLWGERKDLDGQRGKANRINGLVQYNF